MQSPLDGMSPAARKALGLPPPPPKAHNRFRVTNEARATQSPALKRKAATRTRTKAAKRSRKGNR